MLHDIQPEEDDQPEDSKHESLSLREIQELHGQQKKKQASPSKRKVMLTSGRKDKAPQKEEMIEAPRRRSPFLRLWIL